MEHIERPEKVVKAESNVQSNEYIQKNMQEQLDRIYDYLDVIASKLDELSEGG